MQVDTQLSAQLPCPSPALLRERLIGPAVGSVMTVVYTLQHINNGMYAYTTDKQWDVCTYNGMQHIQWFTAGKQWGSALPSLPASGGPAPSRRWCPYPCLWCVSGVPTTLGLCPPSPACLPVVCLLSCLWCVSGVPTTLPTTDQLTDRHGPRVVPPCLLHNHHGVCVGGGVCVWGGQSREGASPPPPPPRTQGGEGASPPPPPPRTQGGADSLAASPPPPHTGLPERRRTPRRACQRRAVVPAGPARGGRCGGRPPAAACAGQPGAPRAVAAAPRAGEIPGWVAVH